jgi:hypothetical protein
LTGGLAHAPVPIGWHHNGPAGKTKKGRRHFRAATYRAQNNLVLQNG